MKPHLMFTGLILAGVLAQPVAVMAGSVGLARFQDERPSQEEPDSTDPAAETDDPAPPQEAEDPGRTTAGASVSSTGTGVGVTSRRDKFFFGGGIGLGFGDIKFVEIWPLFGYNFNPKVRGGMSLIYRYRKDDRIPDSTSTTDYGGSLFVDYFPVPRFFLRGEFEHLNYEFIYQDPNTLELFTEREGFNSVFGGVGFANPIGSNGALNIMLLYNFSHEDGQSPYADPYVIRIGVSFGF
jgi:hypothetical protein